jgi:hypothetical protein
LAELPTRATRGSWCGPSLEEEEEEKEEEEEEEEDEEDEEEEDEAAKEEGMGEGACQRVSSLSLPRLLAPAGVLHGVLFLCHLPLMPTSWFLVPRRRLGPRTELVTAIELVLQVLQESDRVAQILKSSFSPATRAYV